MDTFIAGMVTGGVITYLSLLLWARFRIGKVTKAKARTKAPVIMRCRDLISVRRIYIRFETSHETDYKGVVPALVQWVGVNSAIRIQRYEVELDVDKAYNVREVMMQMYDYLCQIGVVTEIRE